MAATHAISRMYDEQDVERCLRVMALCGGNSREARRRLEAQGHNCPDDGTLREWRLSRHEQRYKEIREQETPKLIERAAAEAEDLVVQLAQIERDTAEELAKKLSTLDAKDLAGTLRNVTTSKALQVDKISSPLRGRPAVIIEHRSSGDLESKLRRVLGAHSVNGTATEVVATPPAYQLPTSRDAANARTQVPSSGTTKD